MYSTDKIIGSINSCNDYLDSFYIRSTRNKAISIWSRRRNMKMWKAVPVNWRTCQTVHSMPNWRSTKRSSRPALIWNGPFPIVMSNYIGNSNSIGNGIQCLGWVDRRICMSPIAISVPMIIIEKFVVAFVIIFVHIVSINLPSDNGTFSWETISPGNLGIRKMAPNITIHRVRCQTEPTNRFQPLAIASISWRLVMTYTKPICLSLWTTQVASALLENTYVVLLHIHKLSTNIVLIYTPRYKLSWRNISQSR